MKILTFQYHQTNNLIKYCYENSVIGLKISLSSYLFPWNRIIAYSMYLIFGCASFNRLGRQLVVITFFFNHRYDAI